MRKKCNIIEMLLKFISTSAFLYIVIMALVYVKKDICELSSQFILILAGILSAVGVFLILQLKERQNEGRDRYENILLAILSLFLLGLQVIIVWNAVFRTSWDPGAVWYGAHFVSIGDKEGIESMAYYFSVYPNNLLLVFVYSMILKLNMLIGEPISNGTMLLSFFQCVLVDITGILFFKVAKKFVGKSLAWIGYAFYFVLIGLSGWIMIPYSDSTGIIFPILLLFIYTCIKDCSALKGKCVGISILLFLGYIGYHIKPMSAIVLIAIVIVEGCTIVKRCINQKGDGIKKYIQYVFSGGIGLLVAICLVGACVRSMNFPVVTETVLSWQHHMMLGLNRDTNGGYSQEDFDYSTSFLTSEEQHEAEYAMIVQRLKDFGVKGYFEHFIKKSAKNYFDASFGFGGLGNDFYTEIFPERGNKLCTVIRSLYYDNDVQNLYKYNLFGRQIIWYMILCVMPFAAWERGGLNDRNRVIILSVLGLMLYLQIFEAHARYLFTFVPLYILVGMKGVYSIINARRKEEKR